MDKARLHPPLAVVLAAVAGLTMVAEVRSLERMTGSSGTDPLVLAQSSFPGLTSFGTRGSGVNQFEGPTSVFVDSAGRILVTDGRNSRLVRINDMAGAGWTTFGSRGIEINQFLFPWGVSVTSKEQIFVADVYRIIRINDMGGGGWTTLGSPGSGVNQFFGLAGIFVSHNGQIFAADMGNDRIVRVNDMTGAGWTTFGPQGSGNNRLERPRSVSVNPAGQIYIGTATGVVRIDDMVGTGWINPMSIAGGSEERWYRAGNNFIGPTEFFGANYLDNRIISFPFTLPPSTRPLPPSSPESPPSVDRPPIIPPPPHEQKVTPYSDLDPAAGQDEAATYEGTLGVFSVTRNQVADWPPCPSSEPAQNYETSELYSPGLRGMRAYKCADGKIYFIGGERLARRYFIGTAKVPFAAPLWRLKLLTVAGKPAIAQLPIRGISNMLRLTVIERFPRDDHPGILFAIDTTETNLEQSVALAARIMGVPP